MKYTYWLFYLKENKELYAYTDSKDLMESFCIFRNTDIFIKEKKSLTPREISNLALEYKELILEKYSLHVYNKNKSININIAVTTNERITLTNTIDNITIGNLILNKAWVNYNIFNYDIIDSLYKIEYTKAYDTVSSKKYDKELNIIPDELGIFIRYFGKTVKGW